MRQRGGLFWILVVAAGVTMLGLSYLAYRVGRNAAAQLAPATRPPAIGALPTVGLLSAPSVTPTPRPSATPPATATETPTHTPSPTPTAIITALPPMPEGFLVTVRQPVQVIKTYRSAPPWWPRFPPFSLVAGSFTLVAYSEVAAGIDFTQVGDSDIIRRGSAVTVTLPGPQLYGRAAIDPAQSYIVEHPGISTQHLGQVIAAQAELQTAAEDWAVGHGILTAARDNGRQMMELWLRRLGFTEIDLRWDDTRPPG